jgi:hypothetical protein
VNDQTGAEYRHVLMQTMAAHQSNELSLSLRAFFFFVKLFSSLLLLLLEILFTRNLIRIEKEEKKNYMINEYSNITLTWLYSYTHKLFFLINIK